MPDSDDEMKDEILPEYDFESMPGVVRGKYADRFGGRLRMVRLAADVGREFKDEAAVNDALREFLKLRKSG
jgi:hypothetical protein